MPSQRTRRRLEPERHLVTEACARCGKPVYADEGYNGATRNHFKCEDRLRKDLDKAIAGMEASMASLGIKRRQKRAGTGAMAIKLQKMIGAALEKELGKDLTDIFLWVQPPSYRGPRWDLAGWGGHATFSNTKVSFSSWDTMTQCAKGFSIALDGIYSYDIWSTQK